MTGTRSHTYRELLIEIGCEELPASWLPRLTRQIGERVGAQLAAARLDCPMLPESFGTPRRLIVRVAKVADRQNDERARRAADGTNAPAPVDEPVGAPPEAPQTLFEDETGIWSAFEESFPRDAFALRLRYHLRRDPADMAVMLDAPSERAIVMRVDRARDRFRMYCEQQSVNRRDTAALIAQVSEESGA